MDHVKESLYKAWVEETQILHLLPFADDPAHLSREIFDLLWSEHVQKIFDVAGALEEAARAA